MDAGLNDIHYIVQGMTSSMAHRRRTLAPLMRDAGFRYVFLGIENVIEEGKERAALEREQRECDDLGHAIAAGGGQQCL